MSCPGWWLNWSVCIERINAMSSDTEPMCGSRSLSSMPHWPCGLNLRLVPISTADSFLMKANRTLAVISLGSGLPLSSFSLGLGSKRSTWLGAPAMKMKIQRLALGAKCGPMFASGLPVLASRLSCCRSDASAAVPMPLALVARKSRRVNCAHSRAASGSIRLAISNCCAGKTTLAWPCAQPAVWRSEKIFHEFGRPGDHRLAAFNDNRPFQ